ncbi:MAG: F0F1 ATP synthase subunit B [Actinomycetes bacterium]
MRIRRFLLAGVLAASAVLAVPSVAHASSNHAKEVYECIEKAKASTASDIKKGDYEPFLAEVKDCSKATSLFVPALPELIWGSIAFLIVLFILMKFAFPALKKGLKERSEKIQGDLDAAARAREDAESEAAQYRSQIGDARSEASTIIEDARADAERIRREVLARADAEAADAKARAQEDIRLAQERAMADLRAQVADIAVGLAEKVVERNLDRATQTALVESYIDSVGNGSR